MEYVTGTVKVVRMTMKIASGGRKGHMDNVNHPAHYETGKFECIDVMVETQGIEATQNFCLCNAFKYLYRHGKKNGVEDIQKANWYLNKYLELEDMKNVEPEEGTPQPV